jgi:hypothetical protein
MVEEQQGTSIFGHSSKSGFESDEGGKRVSLCRDASDAFASASLWTFHYMTGTQTLALETIAFSLNPRLTALLCSNTSWLASSLPHLVSALAAARSPHDALPEDSRA